MLWAGAGYIRIAARMGSTLTACLAGRRVAAAIRALSTASVMNQVSSIEGGIPNKCSAWACAAAIAGGYANARREPACWLLAGLLSSLTYDLILLVQSLDFRFVHAAEGMSGGGRSAIMTWAWRE